MARIQSYVFFVCLGLFFGTGAALLQQRSPPAVLHQVDIAPTRRVEVANACAAATGRFSPRMHNALDESHNPVLPLSTLPDGRLPGSLSTAELSSPCLFQLRRGVVLSLGNVPLGGNDFFRLIDEAGGIKLIGSREVVASANRAWPIPRAPAIDIDLGEACASASALWLDFGVVERNSTQSVSFTIRNDGATDIAADGFNTSCRCITLSVEPRTDPNCHWNKTPINCNQNDTGCPACSLPQYNCTQWTATTYRHTMGIYTLTQVPDGTGAYQTTGTSQKLSCYTQYDCMQSTVNDQYCASGCTSANPNDGVYCKLCSTALLANVGVGQYTVYDVSSTGCGST